MKLTLKKIAALLSLRLMGALLTAPAVAQLGDSHANNWRDDDRREVVADARQLIRRWNPAATPRWSSGSVKQNPDVLALATK